MKTRTVHTDRRPMSARSRESWVPAVPRSQSILVALCAALLTGSALAAAPVPISPGTVTGGLTRDTCPTFLWSSGEGSAGYELVVYPVEEHGELAAVPALSQRLPAGAQGWTPSAERCLRPGARYAWVVREVGSESSGAWSEPAIFEVTVPSRVEVSEAMETLRRYLAGLKAEVDEADVPRWAGSEETGPRPGQPRQEMALPPSTELARPGGPLAAAEPTDDMKAIGERTKRYLTGETGHFLPPTAIYALAPFGDGFGVFGQVDSDPMLVGPGAGVLGYANGNEGEVYGVWGVTSSTQGRGVAGTAFSTSGFTHGVRGESHSTQGNGVHGQAFASSGFTHGVFGVSGSTQGVGVVGWAGSVSGPSSGVWARSLSSQGQGVFGWASSTSGTTYGVRGESASGGGRGVLGENTATGGTEAFGVLGVSHSTGDEGVYGRAVATSGESVGTRGDNYSTQGRGVFGWALATSGLNYGVFGQTESPSGYAGYFAGRSRVVGDLHVDGTLSKADGTFKIDHPLDPANKYLSHSFVESPDRKNVYDGNVILDEEGAAWVDLPEYFAALNREFRYQLTALRRAAPSLHVAETIADNRFRIAGGEPGMEVSWQVTGIRQDAYAETNPMVVEEDKGELRGRYLHPAAHGQPAELAIGYVQPLEMEVAEMPSAPSRTEEQEELANESPAASSTAEPEATLSRPNVETDPTQGDRR